MDNKINFSIKLVTKRTDRKTDGETSFNGYGKVRSNQNVKYGVFAKLHKPGIYSIICNKTNKVYIGSSNDVQRRCIKHFSELRLNRHRCKQLQLDYNIFGYDSFSVEIIEETDEFLLEKEKQYQINKGIENLYNEKISNYYMKEELKTVLAHNNKSSHKTDEYRTKMSKLKTNKIAKFELNGDYIETFDSAIKVCEKFNYTRSVILSACNGSKKTAYGFQWRYVDDDYNIITNGYEKARKNKTKI